MKKVLTLTISCLLALSAMGQDVYQPNLQSDIDWKEDSTEIVTIDDIVKTQQDITVRNYQDSHFRNVWSRKSYFNIGYTSSTLSPKQDVPSGMGDGTLVSDFKSSWGVSLKGGTNYALHKKPIANILQFNIDYNYLDLNVNHYNAENGDKLYTTAVKTPGGKYFIPWNLEKYEFNYGMSVGPSVTLAPFTSIDAKGLHFLKFNVYFHIGYHVSLLNIKSNVDADANTAAEKGSQDDRIRDMVKLSLGHGLTTSFGFSVSWKTIGVGYEHRSASLKYKTLDTSNFDDEKYKFSNSTNRIFIQFRM